MYFNLSKGRAWLLNVGVLLFFTSVVNANDTLSPSTSGMKAVAFFNAQPANCVALRQGRKCFAQIALAWRVPEQGNFCIYQKDVDQPIHCWINTYKEQVIFDFESTEKVAFQLISSDDHSIVAETSVDVSWVHKAAPRKRRWRLF